MCTRGAWWRRLRRVPHACNNNNDGVGQHGSSGCCHRDDRLAALPPPPRTPCTDVFAPVADAACDARLRVYCDYATPPSTATTTTTFAVLDEHKLQALLCDALGCRHDRRNNDDDDGDYYTRLLRRARARTAAELRPLQSAVDATEARVQRVYMPVLRYAVLAVLTLHLAVYVHWIFVVFDWGVVEPTTFFVSYAAVYGGLVYHYMRRGTDALGWQSLLAYLAARRTDTLLRRQAERQRRQPPCRRVSCTRDVLPDVCMRDDVAQLRARLHALDVELRRHGRAGDAT